MIYNFYGAQNRSRTSTFFPLKCPVGLFLESKLAANLELFIVILNNDEVFPLLFLCKSAIIALFSRSVGQCNDANGSFRLFPPDF